MSAAEVRDRNAARNDMLIEATAEASGLDIERAQPAVIAMLDALARHWRAEVDAIIEARRRGWKRLAEQVATCAEHADLIAESLRRHTGPTEPMRPPAEIPVDGRAGSVDELEQRLTEAFGPALAPSAITHIRVDQGDGSFRRLCGVRDGILGYPGSATCEQCIALHDTSDLPDDAGRSAPLSVNEGGDHPADLPGAPLIPLPAPGSPFAFIEPTGPRQKMTFAQIVEHGQARQRGAEHRSVSQVNSYVGCGVAYALSDLERPAWWNVGGTAFHAACEEINRTVVNDGGKVDMGPLGELWMRHFAGAIAAQLAERSDVPMTQWRTAAKGAEGYDWWRVEGEAMVTRYAEWLRGMLADEWSILTIDDTPVIEYETTLDVDGVPVVCVIDLALQRVDGRILIVDLKAGKSRPDETFQLGVYGWALNHVRSGGQVIASGPTVGQYFMARKGELVGDLERPLVELHPWDEIVYRVHQTDRAEKAGIYLPRPSSFCGGCGVSELCPAGNR